MATERVFIFGTLHAKTVVTPPNESQKNHILAVGCIFYGLAAVAALLRIGTRLHRKIGIVLEDYLLMIALIFATIQFALMITFVIYGADRHTIYIKPENINKIFALQEFYVIDWTLTLCFAKLSIAAVLWRLTKTFRWWRITLEFVSVVTVLTAVVTLGLQLSTCKPLSDYWSKSPTDPTRHCRGMDISKRMIIGTSVLYGLTDLYFSLAPVFLISTLQMPRLEKIVICCLMSLGLFATITALIKLRFLAFWSNITDPVWQSADFLVWVGVESYIGILAASVPQLKSLFHLWFKQITARQARTSISKASHAISEHSTAATSQPLSASDQSNGHIAIFEQTTKVEDWRERV